MRRRRALARSDEISGRFRRVEDRYNRYDVVDLDGDKIGTVDHTTRASLIKGSMSP